MGWTRYILLGDIGQQLDLQDHEQRLRRLAISTISKSRRDGEQDARIDELEAEVLQLSAGLAALVGVIRDKHVATDEEIGKCLDAATRAAETALAKKTADTADAARAQAKAAAARKLERARRRR